MSGEKGDRGGIGVDVYVGGPDEPQPDWRAEDEDDGDDNDDPSPIAPGVLEEMLGFDPAEMADEDEDEDDREDEEEELDEDDEFLAEEDDEPIDEAAEIQGVRDDGGA